MKTFEFQVILVGAGDNAEDAWQNALEGFAKMPCPEGEDVEEIDDDANRCQR